jgi:AraC-like DNA-binding protein
LLWGDDFFYNTNMSVSVVRRLHWWDIAPEASLHAALFVAHQAGGYQIALHDHDFCEMLLVVAGRGTHLINGVRQTLATGNLVFLRAADVHAIQLRPGEKLHWMNVAFPETAWRDFCRAAGLAECWDAAPMPPMMVLSPDRLAACVGAFEVALNIYRRSLDIGGTGPPGRLDLCRFLSAVVGFLLPPAVEEEAPFPLPASEFASAPPWLADACRVMRRDPAALLSGLPCLQELSGVSAAHLARSLKSSTGQTPTQFINGLRLARAATLLTTTALPIVQVAGDCGFGQLSYFYRLFRARFGQSPHAYRRAARRPVAPS